MGWWGIAKRIAPRHQLFYSPSSSIIILAIICEYARIYFFRGQRTITKRILLDASRSAEDVLEGPEAAAVISPVCRYVYVARLHEVLQVAQLIMRRCGIFRDLVPSEICAVLMPFARIMPQWPRCKSTGGGRGEGDGQGFSVVDA